jgi:hypothetical protein
MRDSKLVRLVKTFSKAEWKEFEKFANSPYFNRGRNYIPYLRVLKKFYPGFDSEKLTKEHIYSMLYPGKKCNDAVMFTVTSGLYCLAEEFLIQKEVELNQFNRDLHLLNQFSKRNIDGIHNRLFTSIEKKLQTQKAGKDIFELFAELHTHKVQHSMKGNYEKSLAENVPARGDYHIFNFIVVLLNEVRDQVVLKGNYNITVRNDLPKRIYNKIDFEDLIEYTDEHYPKFSPVMKTIMKCYAASLSTDDIYYEAKELMMRHYSLFDKNLLRELVLIMEGGAAMRLNTGDRQYVREWHELHRFSVERGLHIYETQKYVHPLVAHNMLNMAFWNKEYKWIEFFINDHQSEFPDEFRNYLTTIGKVYLHISRKEFNQALKLLTIIDDSLFSFKKRVRTLQQIIYYEIKEHELALNGLDSFKHFIDNNQQKYSERERSALLIFISIYEQLLRHSFGGNEANLKLLKKRILNENPSQSFDWLLEKIEELEAK